MDEVEERTLTHVEKADTHVTLAGICKSFGQTRVVQNLSLQIQKGEFFSIVGASGSGKSTVLRIIAGHETADSGQVIVGGEDVTQTPAYLRPVNMMFQSYALFPHLNVWKNIAFGLERDRLPRNEVAARVEEAMARLDIQRLATRKPHQLSGGERQRTALARAIVKQPPALLLDEPLSALDVHLRERARGELIELRRQLGITFIMVTHDQSDAMSMSDRIAIMRDGQIAQIGTPAQLYDNPDSSYTASFFGEANILSGEFVRSRDNVAGFRNPLGLFFAEFNSSANDGTQPTAFMVRPERIAVSKGRATQRPHPYNSVEGKLTSIEFMGSSIRCRIQLADGDILIADLSRADATDAGIGAGDIVTASWPHTAARSVS